MHRKIDFTKSTSTQHLSNPVKIKGRLWSIFSLLKRLSDLSHDICYFLRSWAQFPELRVLIWLIMRNQLLRSQDFPVKRFLINVWCHLSNFLFFFFSDQRPLWVIWRNVNIVFIELLEFNLVLEFKVNVLLVHFILFFLAWGALNVL